MGVLIRGWTDVSTEEGVQNIKRVVWHIPLKGELNEESPYFGSLDAVGGDYSLKIGSSPTTFIGAPDGYWHDLNAPSVLWCSDYIYGRPVYIGSQYGEGNYYTFTSAGYGRLQFYENRGTYLGDIYIFGGESSYSTNRGIRYPAIYCVIRGDGHLDTFGTIATFKGGLYGLTPYVNIIDYNDRSTGSGSSGLYGQQGTLTPVLFDRWLGNYFPDESDPWEEGGNSSDQTDVVVDFGQSSDEIIIPGDPTLGATSTGLITLFNPTTAQLNSLASFMYTSLIGDGYTDLLANIKKIFANPMDIIYGLNILPVAIPDAGTAELKVCGVGTGVVMTYTNTQYVTVDCGTINISKMWDGYMDFSPYTKIEIYLPYIGVRDLNIDDVMGKTLHLVYKVDILSGACVAYLQGKTEDGKTATLYSYSGSCATSIPLTSSDWTSVFQTMSNIAISTAKGAITGGIAGASVNAASSSIQNLSGFKPSVERSGNIGSTAGRMATQIPYIIITRPRQCKPQNLPQFTGYPSLVTKKLSSIYGYTEIRDIHLEGMSCTSEEQKMIEALLKSGVIL